MKSSQVTANSTQLTRLGFVNCYLVREDDGLTLIDTGLPNTHDDILAAASTLGAPICRILLTHPHMDHLGSVDALIEKLGPESGVHLQRPQPAASPEATRPVPSTGRTSDKD